MEPFSVRSRQPTLAAIREIAKPPRSVVTHEELRSIGFSDSAIRRWCRDGVLERAARGVYAIDRNRSATSDRWAALLSLGGRGVISHGSAIDALGISGHPRRPIDVTVVGARPRKQDGIRLHSAPDLMDGEKTCVDGLWCTSAARTLLDMAASVNADTLDRYLDRVVHLRLFDQRAFDLLLSRRAGRQGTLPLLAALARLDETSGHNRTELERRVVALIRDSYLPTPQVNCRIGGLEVDVHWWGTRAIVEADGGAFHTSPAQIAADIEKQRTLESWGFAIKRLTWAESTYGTDRTLASVDRFRLANLDPPVPGPPPELILSTRLG